MMGADTTCELCCHAGGEILWQDDLCRVVRPSEPGYPDFCRVIWRSHVAEMSDLDGASRRHLLRVVGAVEVALRRLCNPDKINLASLGNVVAHLHWHVIPRYRDDRHFPRPVWAEPLRPEAQGRGPVPGEALRRAIVEAMAEEEGGTT